jgi:hypothetical protein
MTNRNLTDLTDPYADLRVALALYESTGNGSSLDRCIGACIEIGPDGGGRPMTKEICAAIGVAFVQRSLRGAGRPPEPWRSSAVLTIAIAGMYKKALAKAHVRQKRDRDHRTNREWAADQVVNVEHLRELKLTRSSVVRAVSFARKKYRGLLRT